ncbi:cysteine-rich RLK (RECEPTOR-like protein kinase) 8 [Hibiscus trionum]|uniref:Cysteine-rich RLK (RECEPTOR-like protein kinase) 8 n=1 Tax=Hibiscus trionum TaxID=183268 RepID=A0A9W7JL89_HIBTR|nr:cysteine-rich RLK (RECEPTOR-like protein kinase) 8 [Hibiscus trionum]
MKEEIQALEINNTWSLVPLPSGKVPIGCKWVFRVKYNSSGAVERYKARLVAKGYNQKAGVDYTETFSPVAKMVTVRTILALAAAHCWPLYQMDVYNAFLQGDLQEEVYMELPPGFRSQGESRVCRLRKSLYGLKQASRQWNMKLCEALLNAGYYQSRSDYSIFTKRKGDAMVIMLIYVDDLLITGNDSSLISELKLLLNQSFRMKDLGDLKFFLGFEVMRSKEGILLNQRKYAMELIEDLGLGGSKPASTPLEQNVKFTTAVYDKELELNVEDKLLEDVTIFQRLIGRLIYLTHTRPDIMFAVQNLSQFMHQPKESHMLAALRIVKYIKKNSSQGLLFEASNEKQITAYCDSDWASCPISRKSVTGYCIKIGKSLVS